MSPQISVVIPAFNAEQTLPAQLDAVLRQQCSVPFEVVVADNGSTDGTARIIKTAEQPNVRFVDASRARGEATARNCGIQAAATDLIASCDADDVVAPGWLQHIYDGLSASQVVSLTREYWMLNPRLRRGPQFKAGDSFHGIPTFTGGAFGIHRDLYLGLGGFDETFRGSVDTEFAVRVFKSLRNGPTPCDAVVHVRMSTSSIDTFRRYFRLANSAPAIALMHADLLTKPASFSRDEISRALFLLSRAPFLADPTRRLWWMQEAGRTCGRAAYGLRHLKTNSEIGIR